MLTFHRMSTKFILIMVAELQKKNDLGSNIHIYLKQTTTKKNYKNQLFLAERLYLFFNLQLDYPDVFFFI